MKLRRIEFSSLFGMAFFIFMLSCNIDESQTPTFENFFNESFEDLNVATLQELETPYEDIFGSVMSTGRLKGDEIDLSEISEKLAGIFPDAEVLEFETEMERGMEVWVIKLKMPGGGILKLKFVKEIGEIIKIKGTTGPFDYEIDPGGSFIAFSVAKNLALTEIEGEIQKWELELEEDNQWEYEFHIKTDTKHFEVEISGFGEEVFSVKEKHEGDEVEDDDGDEDEENKQAPEEINTFVSGLFEAKILHSESKFDEDFHYWKLYIKNEDGAVVKFKVFADPVSLLMMEGEIGPFDYDIDPGDDFISFTEALDIVNEGFEAELEEWKFKKFEMEDGLQWAYKLEFKGDDGHDFLLNAINGDILIADHEEEDQEDHEEEPPPEEVLTFISNLFEGEVIQSDSHEDEDGIIWKIHVKNENGAIVMFKIAMEPVSLLRMYGEHGPFDYDITIGDDLISFAKALETARMKTDGDLMGWSFRQREMNDEVNWVYEFYFKEGDKEVKIGINALTGEIFEEHHEGHEMGDPVPDDIVEFVTGLFPGEIIHGEVIEDGDRILWIVAVKNEMGAVVLFKVSPDPLALHKMIGETGPFDYNIDPGDDLISFADAKEVALLAIEGELTRWMLWQKEIDDGLLWVYEFRIVSGDMVFEVQVNAHNGELLMVEQGEFGNEEHLPEAVLNYVNGLFGGEIVHSELGKMEEVACWKLEVINDAGSVVLFNITMDLLPVSS